MDCFSDPVCLYNSLVSAVTHGAAYLDHVGTSVLGDHWVELVPVIEEYAGEIRRLANLITPRPMNSCGPGADGGSLNA